MNRLTYAAPLLALVAACSSGSSTPEAADSPAPSSAAPKPASACLTAPSALLAKVQDFATSGTGLKVVKGAAWKSPDYAKVYFVAARFSATGVGEETGVWATNDLSGGGMLLAVDGFAQEFSDAPDANNTAAEIKASDPGVDKAKDCL